MLLPKNVQRRQWVNWNYRHKVVFNVAGYDPMPHSAKALRLEDICNALLDVFIICTILHYAMSKTPSYKRVFFNFCAFYEK